MNIGDRVVVCVYQEQRNTDHPPVVCRMPITITSFGGDPSIVIGSDQRGRTITCNRGDMGDRPRTNRAFHPQTTNFWMDY